MTPLDSLQLYLSMLFMGMLAGFVWVILNWGDL